MDAMAGYKLNDNLALQLNLYNLLDEEYVAAINKSGYRYPRPTPHRHTKPEPVVLGPHDTGSMRTGGVDLALFSLHKESSCCCTFPSLYR